MWSASSISVTSYMVPKAIEIEFEIFKEERRQGMGKGDGLGGRTLAGMEYIYT